MTRTPRQTLKKVHVLSGLCVNVDLATSAEALRSCTEATGSNRHEEECVSITCLPSFVQERKPRIHQLPSKSFDDAQGGVRQLLARIEEPQQRHRSVDVIADQKINLLDVNWKLFHDFANSVNLETAPFKLPQLTVDVDLERQVNQDQVSGINTQLFALTRPKGSA